MSSAPDSTLALLQELKPEALSSRRQEARYALLKTIALDKNYVNVTDDSLALVAYDYYQRHGSAQNRMKSVYYLGVVRENAEELIDAALLFKEAEMQAERLMDKHFLGLSRQHLSSIFARNYDHNEALEYALTSASAFYEADELVSARYSMVDAARQYLLLDKWATAKAIADTLFTIENAYTPLYYHILFLNADLSYSAQEYEDAYHYYEQARESSHPISVEGLGNIAFIKEIQNNSFQADSLLGLSSKKVRTRIDSAIYYNAVNNVMFLRREYKDAYEFLRIATQLQNSAIIELMDRSITHSFKNHFENKYILERERSLSRLYLLLFVISFGLICMGVFVYLIRRKNLKIQEEMAIIDDISKDISSLQSNNNNLNSTLQYLIQDKIQVMQRLSDTYFQWSDEALSQREKKEGKVLRDDAIDSFRLQLRMLRSDNHFIDEIENVLNSTQEGIVEWLRTDFCKKNGHNLKEQDVKILTLILAGFSIKSVSFLVNMTEPSIRTRKTRYKQMFQSTIDERGRVLVRMLS